MEYSYMKAVRDCVYLPAREKYLLLVLGIFDGGEGAWPSKSTLERVTGHTKKTVIEGLKMLECLGLIRKSGRKGKNEYTQTTAYALSYPIEAEKVVCGNCVHGTWYLTTEEGEKKSFCALDRHSIASDDEGCENFRTMEHFENMKKAGILFCRDCWHCLRHLDGKRYLYCAAERCFLKRDSARDRPVKLNDRCTFDFEKGYFVGEKVPAQVKAPAKKEESEKKEEPTYEMYGQSDNIPLMRSTFSRFKRIFESLGKDYPTIIDELSEKVNEENCKDSTYFADLLRERARESGWDGKDIRTGKREDGCRLFGQYNNVLLTQKFYNRVQRFCFDTVPGENFNWYVRCDFDKTMQRLSKKAFFNRRILTRIDIEDHFIGRFGESAQVLKDPV